MRPSRRRWGHRRPVPSDAEAEPRGPDDDGGLATETSGFTRRREVTTGREERTINFVFLRVLFFGFSRSSREPRVLSVPDQLPILDPVRLIGFRSESTFPIGLVVLVVPLEED